MIRSGTIVVLFALMSSCASSSHRLIGTARSAINPSEVVIYTQAPAHFEEIAMLDASSRSVFSPGGEKTKGKVIDRLKEQAAKLGANGVILEGFADRESGSLGTGVGSQSYSQNSSVGLGVGGSVGIYSKTGRGKAIYVAPAAPP